MMLGKLYNTHTQKNEIRLISITLQKKNFKWIKVLTVKPEKLKLLEENTASTLHYTGKGKD